MSLYSMDSLKSQLRDYCLTQPIQRLEIYGEAGGDLEKQEDFGILLTLEPGVSLTEEFQIAGELEDVVGREVTVLLRNEIENYLDDPNRQALILDTAEVVYEGR